jgi:hypothetical protein
MQVKAFFDNGGPPSGTAACPTSYKNRDGSCGVVSDCEVVQSSLLRGLLQADVQMLDAAGLYHPITDGSAPDSMSIGFGFTVARARF